MSPFTVLEEGGKCSEFSFPTQALPSQLRLKFAHCPGSLNSPTCLSEDEGERDIKDGEKNLNFRIRKPSLQSPVPPSP